MRTNQAHARLRYLSLRCSLCHYVLPCAEGQLELLCISVTFSCFQTTPWVCTCVCVRVCACVCSEKSSTLSCKSSDARCVMTRHTDWRSVPYVCMCVCLFVRECMCVWCVCVYARGRVRKRARREIERARACVCMCVCIIQSYQICCDLHQTSGSIMRNMHKYMTTNRLLTFAKKSMMLSCKSSDARAILTQCNLRLNEYVRSEGACWLFELLQFFF